MIARAPTQARHAWPGDADWLPAARPWRRDALPRRDPDGQDLPDAGGRAAARRGLGEQGPDADDPALTLEEWRKRIAKYSGELKNMLRNQEFVSGIGNAYSDEVLWAARLDRRFRKRSSLAADEVDDLYAAMREVLAWAIGELHELRAATSRGRAARVPEGASKGGEAVPALRRTPFAGQCRRV